MDASASASDASTSRNDGSGTPDGSGAPGASGGPRAGSGRSVAGVSSGPRGGSGSALVELDRRVAGCGACPRLVAWREEVARDKRAAFADWTYWGRPVPGFGPADARLLIVGLAPAAHGGNRTGRMFTGDRSGDVLYQALYDVGLTSQPTAVSVDDGLELYGVRVTSPVHCAPPANRPTPGERDTCRPWLVQELRLLRPTLRAVVVLGAFGWQAALPAFAEAGWVVPRPRPGFAHGTRVRLDGPQDGLQDGDGLDVFGCFHVSQRNTFTGRLTPEMLRDVLRTAAGAAGLA
ncbi:MULTISPECIES: uracil-DNA glycosylase [unclassified Streptomyces]|uniref:uracil-DNA glycosylase n=1 Tax=unclassified Streptomyces TaxID=2593676 RepID=UPI002FEE6684